MAQKKLCETCGKINSLADTNPIYATECVWCQKERDRKAYAQRDQQVQTLLREKPELFQQCGECKKWFFKTGLVCPACHPVKVKMQLTGKQVFHLIFGLSVIVVLPLFLLVRCLMPVTAEEAASNSRHAKDRSLADACDVAVDAIRPQLKSPSTANFPSCIWGDYTYSHYDDKVVVVGYVDAENSFGAKVRTYFNVVVERPGGLESGSGSWTVDMARLNEN